MSLSNIPEIDFTEKDTEKLKKSLIKYVETVEGRMLARADPTRLLLETLAAILVQMYIAVDHAAKMNLLKYAKGDFLDNLGILVGTERLQSVAATTTLKFTLSAKQPGAVIIPAGTRVTTQNKDVYFATNEPLVIPAQGLSGTVKATCLEKGTKGNDYASGMLNVIVDPIAYVASTENTTDCEGGSDVEQDEKLRERIQEAPESFGSGTDGDYANRTKEVSSLISDVAVYRGGDGIVCIVPLLEGGIIPGEEMLQSVESYVSQSHFRYLTDKLDIKAPKEVKFDLHVQYTISRKNATSAVTIQKAVTNAVNEYITWQKEKLGRDIDSSELVYRMKAAGAKHIQLDDFTYTVIARDEVAVANSVLVNFGGLEDD